MTTEDRQILSADAAWHAAQAKTLYSYMALGSSPLKASNQALLADIAMHEQTAAALKRVLEGE